VNIDYLEACLQKYNNFDGSGLNISEALSAVLTYFEKQGADNNAQFMTLGEAFQPLPTLQPYFPCSQTTVPDKAEKLIIERNLLNQVLATKEQISSLKSQIDLITNEIQHMYKTLQNIRYHLHAICVHDGSAEGGHYFTFIKDHYQDIWRKFNDIRVTTVSEAEVME
jgi:hypothetical protein